MFDHLTETEVTDLKIALTAFFLLGVFRVVVWARDTRYDFDRPKKHGEMK